MRGERARVIKFEISKQVSRMCMRLCGQGPGPAVPRGGHVGVFSRAGACTSPPLLFKTPACARVAEECYARLTFVRSSDGQGRVLRIAPAQGEPALLSCAVVLFPLLCVADACLRPLTPILGAPPVRRKPTVSHLRVVSLFAAGVLSEAHWICWAGAAQEHGAACVTNALAAVAVILLVRRFFDSTGVLGAPRSRAALFTKRISLGRFLVNVLVVAVSTELANFGWACGRALHMA